MGYIVTAEVFTDSEVNIGADRTKVAARVLSDSDGTLTFDVPGDFDPARQKAIVLDLCRSLVEAGFVEFSIGHSR